MTRGRALITGGARRLGAAMALYLAGRGFDVAIHYANSAEDAEAVAKAVEDSGRRDPGGRDPGGRDPGVRACTLRADLLHEAETQTLVARAAEALGGPLNVLVNNASIFEYDSLQSASRTGWDRHMESNLRAPFVLTQNFAAQAPQTDRSGPEPLARALIVNMLDQRVLKPTPEFMTYTLAKMGLWALTRTAAQALAPQVRVNAIGPGPTLQGARQSAEHFARQRAATILERGADAEGICAALGYFLDAPAVTGQLLCVDGGQHLGWKTPDVLGWE